MPRKASLVWLTLLVSVVFTLTACSAGASPSPSQTAAASPSAAAPASDAPSAAPSELPGSKEFSIAFTSVGLSSAPFLAAIDSLNKAGYTIKTEILAESELVTEGVASGTFVFGSGANNSTLAAVEKGADLKLAVTRVQNEWTLYAKNDIADCAALDGKKLAIHSQGAVSTSMVKNYVATICSGTEPEYIVIEGSPNRVAALRAGQIDASPLELADAIGIDAQDSDRFHQIASFANDLPELQTTSIYFNGTWANDNPGSAVAVIKALIEQHRLIEGDAAYLKSIAEQFVPDAINADTIDLATEKYVELKMFPTDGGLTEENLQYTVDFFGPEGTKSTETQMTVDQVADLQYLQLALDALGN